MMGPRDILQLPMQRNDANAATIKDYLKALLATLMREGEGFSGKRPFGNSGWDYDLFLPLLKAGIVKGKLDEDGYIEDINQAEAEGLILSAIEAL
jgi:hypothetical protein